MVEMPPRQCHRSAPAPLSARLAALGSAALPERGRATVRPAAASSYPPPKPPISPPVTIQASGRLVMLAPMMDYVRGVGTAADRKVSAA